MRVVVRIFPLLFLAALLMSLVVPAAGQELMSVSAESCDYGGEFQTIEAVDAMTVKFTLCFPDPAFPSKVAFSSFNIHPSEYLESTGGSGDLIQNPVGTGPYMLENWDLGNEIVMTRYDSYWGEPAQEQTLIFRWNSEAAARLTELQAGTVDGIDNIGPADFETVRNDSNLALFEREGLNVFYLGLNNWIPPLDNVQVRQAIAHAIDKQRIVDNFYPVGSQVATQFMPPALFGFTEEVEPFSFDPDRAVQLLEESGVALPIELPLNYRDVVRGYLPTPGVVATDIQDQLNSLGGGGYFNITVEVMESTAFLDASDRGELSIYLLGWGADYPDATNFLDFHFGAGATDQFGDKHEEITEPLAQAAQLADPEARYPIYVEANTAIRDLVPMVPIAHGASALAFQARIEGAHSSPLGNESFAVMSDPDDDNIIWMQNGEPGGIYCADETDGEALRACEQINESLLGYEVGGTEVIPVLAAELPTFNEEATEWTFTLREGVTFHDGSTLDANDVVLSFAIQWDASHPLHVGRDGNFAYFTGFFTQFLNAPES